MSILQPPIVILKKTKKIHKNVVHTTTTMPETISSSNGGRGSDEFDKLLASSSPSTSAVTVNHSIADGLLTPPPPPPPAGKTRKNKKIISPMEKIKIWEMFDNIPISDVDDSSPEVINIGNKNDSDVSPSKGECCETHHPVEPIASIEQLSMLKPKDDEMYKIRHLCQNCDSVLLIMEDGVPTCMNSQCGMIYTDVVDYSPEWKFYNSGDNKHGTDTTRCGNPINPLLMESSFGCKILCNGASSFEMKRIRKWTEWTSTPHREKSLYEEFQFITTMAHNSGIPKIFIDCAMAIHKDISEQKMFRGMNRDGIKAASIYISCKLNGCPRTAHEIAEIFKLDKQSTTLGCSNAIKILNNVERNMEYSNKSEFKTTTASSFIERYCCKLGISQELTLLAKFIAIKTEKTELLCDNTPQSSAAGIIQFISQTFHLGISKMNIKAVCGVSEVTISKCCKKMESIKEQIIPHTLLKKYGIS